jgi:hypothetical protein
MPVSGFSPFSPHYDQYSPGRLAEALNAAIPLQYIGKIRQRRAIQSGCDAVWRNLRLGFMVNARNFITVN